MTACIAGFVTGKGQKAKGSSTADEMCEKTAQTGGQKDAPGGRIIAFVSYAIPASCTTHIGPPPYPLLWGGSSRGIASLICFSHFCLVQWRVALHSGSSPLAERRQQIGRAHV